MTIRPLAVGGGSSVDYILNFDKYYQAPGFGESEKEL